MKQYFSVLAEKGIPQKLDGIFARVKELVPSNFTGELSLLLVPLKHYNAVRDLVTAARKWRDSQNNLEEKSFKDYATIAKRNNDALWSAISSVDDLDLFR
jgi:hypothetical protein